MKKTIKHIIFLYFALSIITSCKEGSEKLTSKALSGTLWEHYFISSTHSIHSDRMFIHFLNDSIFIASSVETKELYGGRFSLNGDSLLLTVDTSFSDNPKGLIGKKEYLIYKTNLLFLVGSKSEDGKFYENKNKTAFAKRMY